jgi:ABC-type nickel/cobalt efflux system permease component RcnA
MRTLLCLAVLSAHPIEEKVYDRIINVRLTNSAVVVSYVLEANARTAYSDVPDLVSKAELAEITRAEQVYRAFLNGLAPQLRKTLYATLDAKELVFVCKQKQFRVPDHLSCEYVFEAAWQPAAGTRHRFVFREPNFEDEKGTVRLSLTAAAGVKLISSIQPDDALLKRNPLDLRPGDQERLRTASAVFELASTQSDPTPTRSASEGTQEAPPHKRSLEELILHSGLGFGALLAVVAFFGAAHALTPGHGKTLVAAYLVGERGTFGHALLLGLIVTLTHTSSVLLLAALPYVFPGISLQSAHSALVFGGGLLIAALGFWMLLRRLAGQADHVHLIGHHHHHAHGHEHSPPDRPVTLGSLFLLGIGGGIIPCADAIVIFMLCVKWQQPRLALPLVVAFSAGLAIVLVVIGMGVVYAKNLSLARWGERPRVQKFFRLLPLVSAVTITLIGLWMCSAGMQSAGD